MMSASRERVEELLRPVEVAHADADRAEALGDVAVRARAAHDAVLGREADGLLVEGGDRDARVEDLDRVDVLDDRRAGARSRARSACGRTGAGRRRARPGGGSRRSSPPASARAGSRSSRNRPMTSPWSAVLTSSPTMTLTPNSAALRAGGQRAGDLVVVGDGDRAEARVAGGGQQHLDRRRAVVRVVGVHVQVDVDQRPRLAAAPGRAARARRVPAGRDLGVERLDAVGHRAPGERRRAPRRRAPRSRVAQRVVARPGARAGRRACRRRRARTAARGRRRSSTSS